MKLFSCLKKWLILPLILLAQTISAQSPNTEVRMSGGTMTYGQIFDMIETQGNVWFGYAAHQINVNKPVSIPGGMYPINELLDWLFKDTAYKYVFSGKHILILLKDAPEPPPVEETFTAKDYVPKETRLPAIALKSNLLYDLTTTINFGVEIGLATRWTLDIPVNYNVWEFDNDMRLRHWGLQPEVRYWTCQRFDGWFVGLHGHYAQFNVGAFSDRSFISENMQTNRYEGYLYGAGVSGGYSWIMNKRWSIEATLGLGYAHLVYDKYPCAECGTSAGRKTKDYFGPTKAGVSLVFMIK